MSALEPSLTAYDRKILAAVAPCGEYRWATCRVGEAFTIWEIAETLDTTDIVGLASHLEDFRHLGYIQAVFSASRKREVWRRTQKGDKALGS